MRSLFWRMLILLCIGILLTSQALPGGERKAAPALAASQGEGEAPPALESADLVIQWKDPVS